MRNEINIAQLKDSHRVLRNSILGVDGTAIPEKGTRIVYWSGQTWSLSEYGRRVGQVARLLAELGHCYLFQRKVGPEKYEWIAEVR